MAKKAFSPTISGGGINPAHPAFWAAEFGVTPCVFPPIGRIQKFWRV